MSRGKPRYTCPLNLRIEEEVFIELVNRAVDLKKKNVSVYVREILRKEVGK